MDPFRRDDCISAMMQALVFAISELTTLSIESVLTDGRYGRAEQDRGSSADIGNVAAYGANNSLPAADLPALINSIHRTLGSIGQAPALITEAEAPKPAVPIKKSVTEDYLISLFDGRKFKSLKRHLSAEHGMTPDEYRTMFGLPKDYPMVAPAYATTIQLGKVARSRTQARPGGNCTGDSTGAGA